MINTNDRTEPLDAQTIARMEIRRPGSFEGPTFMYGPGGASQIFNHPEEVPEGWVDNPNKLKLSDRGTAGKAASAESLVEANNRVDLLEKANIQLQGDLSAMQGKLDAAEARAAAAEAKLVDGPAAEDDSTDDNIDPFELPPIDDIEPDAIKAELTNRNIRFNASWKKDRLYNLLADAVKGA